MMMTQFLKTMLIVTLSIIVACSTMAQASKPTAVPVVELTYINTFVWATDVNPVTTDSFVAALVGKRVMLDSKAGQNAQLYVIINSPGGQYYYAQNLIKMLEKIPNVTLICRYCASAGSLIFGTSKHPRYVTKISWVLLHEMFLPHYTARDAKNPAIAQDLIKSSDEFNAALYKQMGISKEEYEKKIAGKEWNIKGADIVKYKLADKLVRLKCDEYVKTLAPASCADNESGKEE